MRTILPEIYPISLRDALNEVRLDLNGKVHRETLEHLIWDAPASALVAFDLRGLEYLGYSYSKQTIRELLLARNEGRYGDRRLILMADRDKEFLEGLSDALQQMKLFMLVCDQPESLEGARLIGDVPPHIAETFEVLRKTAPITTGSLARLINQSPQNTKNRLDRLFDMGLLRREKQVSPTGGLEWENRIF